MLQIKFYTKSQNTKTHDDFFAGDHSCNDTPQHSVVTNKCDESLGEFSIAADVHRDTAVEDGNSFTENKEEKNIIWKQK